MIFLLGKACQDGQTVRQGCKHTPRQAELIWKRKPVKLAVSPKLSVINILHTLQTNFVHSCVPFYSPKCDYYTYLGCAHFQFTTT